MNAFIKFKFNKPLSFYYLTDKNLLPNSKTDKLYRNTNYRILEKVYDGDQSIFLCKSFRNKCISKMECVDKCFVLKYYETFLKLPTKIPILPKRFEKKKFTSLFFNLKFNEETLKVQNLKKFCFNLYFLKDCYKKKFQAYPDFFKNTTKKLTFALRKFVYKSSIIANIDKNELSSSVLTSFNIWLGLNIPKLINNFVFIIDKKIVLFFNPCTTKNLTSNRFFKVLFFLTISLGLAYNIFIVVNTSMKQTKISSVTYNFPSKIKYPSAIICLDYKIKANLGKKMKFSGNLLDQFTFTAENVFESITYLNNDFKFQSQNNFKQLETNKSFEILRMSHFYFMKLKCFVFTYKFEIPLNYFYGSQNGKSLFTIKLKKNITNYYFSLGTKKSFSFNHLKKLKLNKHLIFLIKTSIKYEDSYAFFKKLVHLLKNGNFYNFSEENLFFELLKKKFKETKNLTTLLLPLSKKYFNLTINDKNFLNFYKYEIRKTFKNPNESFCQDYFLKIETSLKNFDDNQIKLRSKLLTVSSKYIDKIPFENFCLIFLNIISFWLSLSLINAFSQFNNFFKSFLH